MTQFDSGYGRVKALTYPTGLTVASLYNARGFLTETQDATSGYVYQKITSMNERGQITGMDKAGGVLKETQNYALETGQMTSVTARNTVLGNQRHSISYGYDSFGNLKEQTVENMRNNLTVTSTESYFYYNLHRLSYSDRIIDQVNQERINYNYDAVGNITQKSDYVAGNGYTYGNAARTNGNAGPNAVRSIIKVSDGSLVNFAYDTRGNMLSGDGKTLSYNAFNKTVSISKDNITSNFHYAANLQRYKQVKTGLPNGTKTTIYIDKEYEKITHNGITQQKVYIADTIITKTDGGNNAGTTLHFVHRDRLGSVVTITDADGNVVDNKSYDPFGKPRKGTFDVNELINSASLQTVAFADAFELITQRGFTDHEHLDDAELIHMNGRVYDYNIARFLSVDPLIHAEGGSQGINPYSYIMNNPLSGTDPSGYDPNGLKEETIKVSGEVATYTDSKGNTYVDTGDGGGLVKVSSITANYSSGKSETTSYSNGKETSTSVTSASATSNISDIGSQQQLSQYQSDVFSDDTRTFNGDNEFEPGLSQNGVQVAGKDPGGVGTHAAGLFNMYLWAKTGNPKYKKLGESQLNNGRKPNRMLRATKSVTKVRFEKGATRKSPPQTKTDATLQDARQTIINNGYKEVNQFKAQNGGVGYELTKGNKTYKLYENATSGGDSGKLFIEGQKRAVRAIRFGQDIVD